MNFRTELPLQKCPLSISHQDNILFLGSCFTENIGQKVQLAKFNACVNPLGITFNPISLHNHLNFPSNNEKQLIVEEKEGIYFHLDFHSEFNSSSQSAYIDAIQKQTFTQTEQLQKSNTIFITYGTAWVYETVSGHQLVNNCHKLPAKNFTKRLLSVEEIATSFNSCIKLLAEKYHNDYNFIFTLSPVRHLKDGWHQNQLSKSTLLLAINSICEQHANCSYFPAYEIMMDDLRDYRFYTKDMIHPNEQATEYIWEKFKSTYFDAVTISLIQEIEKAQRSFSHKAFHKKSKTHQQFLKKLLEQFQQLAAIHKLDFEQEIKNIQQHLLP